MATDSIAIIKAVFPANAQRYGLSDPRIQAELQTGFIDQYSGSNPADCAKSTYNPAQYTQTGGGAGVIGIFAGQGSTGAKISSSIALGLKAIPLVGDFLSQLWTSISPFAHHGAAVAREQSTLCSLIPQVNQELAATDAAVQSGDLSAAEADAQLEQMVQGFVQSTASITKDSGSTCNAGCVMRAVVRAEADIHEQGYRNSPLYYLKHYWWIAALAFGVYLLKRRA